MRFGTYSHSLQPLRDEQANPWAAFYGVHLVGEKGPACGMAAEYRAVPCLDAGFTLVCCACLSLLTAKEWP